MYAAQSRQPTNMCVSESMYLATILYDCARQSTTANAHQGGNSMLYFLLFFVLTQLALAARYIVYGAFEPLTYASTFLLPIAALATYVFSKRAQQQELTFTPPNVDSWSFLLKQHTFTNEKPLFYRNERRGYVQRYFQSRFEYILANIVGQTFFVSLRVQIDNDTWTMIPEKTKLLAANSSWRLYKNDELVGQAKTVITWAQTKKLEEKMELALLGETYVTSASTVTSTITLLHNDTTIGMSKRHHLLSNIHIIEADESTYGALLCALLHIHHFKQS